MTSADFLERANYCRHQATAAISDELRAHWLKVAEMWLQMASDYERRGSDGSFQAATAAKGNGQKESDASH